MRKKRFEIKESLCFCGLKTAEKLQVKAGGALFFLFFGLLMMNLFGCQTVHKFMHRVPPAKPIIVTLPVYSGLKARLAVADFDIKTAKATNEIGTGLQEMLAEALLNTNRFIIAQRQETKADLIITATIMEFEPQFSGGSDGIGGGGGVGSGNFGGLLGASLNKAHMTLEIRVVDASTSEVLAATQVQGQARDINTTVPAEGAKNLGLNPRLLGYVNTPMEKAIRVSIDEAVGYIIKTISTVYYKY